jgi:oligopeptide transport system permease protein
MRKYLLRRVLQAPLVLVILVTVSFFLIRLAPGGPFSAERKLDPVAERELNEKYGFDRPIGVQYLRYLGGCVRGDLGPSIRHKATTVNEIIGEHLPQSCLIGGIAIGLALIIGLSGGVYSAVRHNRLGDYVGMSLSMVAISVPPFVIGPMLALIVGLWLSWLPTSGYEGPFAVRYLVLPALTLALPFAARIARLTRAGMLDVIHQDFVRTARAKGLPERIVILRHVLRGGILPVIGFLGPAIAGVLTGSLVVEQIFQIPGLGREFVESALNRDYFLVMGTTIVYGAILMLCNLVADVVYGFLDPRVRFQ